MTRSRLLAGLSGAAFLLAVPAFAAKPLPDNATITVDVRITAKSTSQGDITSSSIDHSFTGSCVLYAASKARGNLETGEADVSGTEAMQQKMPEVEQGLADADVDAFAAEISAQMDACGADEACAMAVMQKAMSDPRFQQSQQILGGVSDEAQQAATAMQDTNLQFFVMKSCSGTMRVNDTHVTDNPGYEGGEGAYKETVTIQGEKPASLDSLMPWSAQINADFKAEKSIYGIQPPTGGQFPAKSTLKGEYDENVRFLPDGVDWPNSFGPKPGFLTGGKETLGGGKVKLEWTVKKGG